MLAAKILQCIAIHRIDMVKAMFCAIMPTLTDIERRWQGWCLQEAISLASLWQAREASAEQNDAPAAETWARPGPGPSPHSPRRQNSRPRDYTPPPQRLAAYSKPGRHKCYIIQIAGSSPQQTRNYHQLIRAFMYFSCTISSLIVSQPSQNLNYHLTLFSITCRSHLNLTENPLVTTRNHLADLSHRIATKTSYDDLHLGFKEYQHRHHVLQHTHRTISCTLKPSSIYHLILSDLLETISSHRIVTEPARTTCN